MVKKETDMEKNISKELGQFFLKYEYAFYKSINELLIDQNALYTNGKTCLFLPYLE